MAQLNGSSLPSPHPIRHTGELPGQVATAHSPAAPKLIAVPTTHKHTRHPHQQCLQLRDHSAGQLTPGQGPECVDGVIWPRYSGL